MRVVHTERTNQDWPINITRLEGKREESSDGYRLDVEMGKAVLTKNDTRRKIMVVCVEETGQKVGMAEYGRGVGAPTWTWYTSMDELSKSQLRLYKTVLQLVEDIRWKVAKVIFNNSSICKGGVIRLMENGDMRMKDKHGNMYSVRAKSNEVYEGNPKNPSGTVSNRAKKDEILSYRDICKTLEAGMERAHLQFPFISYDISDDTKTVKRNAREAMVEPSRDRAPSGLGERNQTSRELPVHSRAKSTCSHVKKPSTETLMTNWSAPGGSMQQSDKENGGRQITITRSKGGEILGIKDKTDGSSLRVSSSTPHQFIYTGSNGRENRFIFTGDYTALSSNESFLLRKLFSRR